MYDVQPETRQNPCSHRTPILLVGMGSERDKPSVFLDLRTERAEPYPRGPASVGLGSGLTISIPTSSHLKPKLLQIRGHTWRTLRTGTMHQTAISAIKKNKAGKGIGERQDGTVGLPF